MDSQIWICESGPYKSFNSNQIGDIISKIGFVWTHHSTWKKAKKGFDLTRFVTNLASLTRDTLNYTVKFRGIYTVGWKYRRKTPNTVG